VIDFCLDDICRLDWISYFPSLKELICVTQGISEIESIDKCKLVERIWLNNNQIEHIKLFDRLPMLKHLFLGSNKISKIRGLEKCV
jgi:protein phosphatase 1 regulatory subunit 7